MTFAEYETHFHAYYRHAMDSISIEGEKIKMFIKGLISDKSVRDYRWILSKYCGSCQEIQAYSS